MPRTNDIPVGTADVASRTDLPRRPERRATERRSGPLDTRQALQDRRLTIDPATLGRRHEATTEPQRRTSGREPSSFRPQSQEGFERVSRSHTNAYCIHLSYNACMTTLSVRDVPEETLALLRVRAAANRQSLQAYIREMLDREAYALSIEQAAREADRLAGSVDITTDDVLTAIEEMRQARQ